MDRGSQLDEEDEEDEEEKEEEKEEKEKEEEEEKRKAANIKSNNPHLAGGEQSRGLPGKGNHPGDPFAAHFGVQKTRALA